MKRRSPFSGFILPMLFLGLASLALPMKSWALAVGDAAPDFTLTDSNGKTQTLSQSKGKYVVLEWFNEGCPYVQKHYKGGNMQGLQKQYAAKGVVWYSIISSASGKQGHGTPAQVNARAKEWNAASSAFLLDTDGKVGKLYAAKTTPHMYVISPEGKVIYMGAIDDKATSDPEDIKTSKNYVKEALDQAMAGKPVATTATVPYGCSVKYN